MPLWLAYNLWVETVTLMDGEPDPNVRESLAFRANRYMDMMCEETT